MSAVRASNAQREQIVGQLNQALVDGRLSVAEFEERSMAASAATWADELPRFTDDLPGRATNGQRAYVVEKLGQAAAQGYLQFPEFEERSAAVAGTIRADELLRFTTDLPRSFRFVPRPAEPPTTGRNPYLAIALRAVRRYPGRTAIASLAAVALGIVSISVSSGPESTPPETGAAVLPVPVMSTSATPTPTPTTPAPTTPASATPAATTVAPAAFTITCQTGESGETMTYSSFKQAWAEKGGAYLCDAEIEPAYRMTSLEKAAVAIDQRIGNGDSTTDSLAAITSSCAETVDFDSEEMKPEPFDLGHFEDFDLNRLQAVYKLCPGAPAAHFMREAIFDLRTS
jgi:Domain of unknown function (DUF1707)